MMTERDLAPSRPSGDLIDAIWAARREGRTDLSRAIATLLRHEAPIVREEALSLLLIKWRDHGMRQRARSLLQNDPDLGVRTQAAYGLAVVSTPETRGEDLALIRSIVLSQRQDPVVRIACYRALFRLFERKVPVLEDDFDVDGEADLEWVRQLNA